MSEFVKYRPDNLSIRQARMVVYLFKNPRAAQIATLLCKGESYLNEIQKRVGGSKTKTVQTLLELEKLKVITSDWKIEKLDGNGPLNTRAIRQFRLNADKKELVGLYEPLLKRLY